MRKVLTVMILCVGMVPAIVSAHCEIPCGVYDDGARFTSIMEHAKTIEKSMLKINELSHATKPDYHMITRWTVNKEKHAQEIQDIVSVYFLTQRVKAPKNDAQQARYVKHLTMLHQLLVASMKAKQTTDVSHVETIRALTQDYKAHYFAKHGHSH